MKRVLVINPNTTAAVTESVLAACRQARPGLHWEGATGRFGAPYISSEVDYAIAGHAVLDAHEAFFAGQDAILIACFGDPGLLALREKASVPVLGLAQASLRAAGLHGRFAVVTGGRAWGPMLARFARAHQLDAQLAGIHTVELTGAQIAASPERALGDLAAACAMAAGDGAECILLGGAALTGLTTGLQPLVALPLLDNVVLAAQAVVECLEGAPAGKAAPDPAEPTRR